MLRLEAGTHLAPIQVIDSDNAGRLAVSAASDMTARVWDIRSGRLLTVLRAPSDVDSTALSYRVAMTRDGDTVALGAQQLVNSRKTWVVYVFQARSGRLLRRFVGLPTLVSDLAFSPDGRWLALSMDDALGGLRLWDWRTAGSAHNVPATTGLEQGTSKISWSSDGRLAAASYDGQIRLYRIESERLVQVAQGRLPGGAFVTDLAFSPTGRDLAISYLGSFRVDILSGHDLSLQHTKIGDAAKKTDGMQLSWSADGNALIMGGTLGSPKRKLIRRWPNAGRGAASDVAIDGDTIQGLRPLPDGAMLVAVGASLGVLSAAGTWHPFRPAASADFRSGKSSFGVSETGSDVQFVFEPNGSLFSFSLPGRSILPTDPHHFVLPRIGPATQEMLKGVEASLVLGSLAGNVQRDELYSVAVGPEAAGVATGGRQTLRYLDAAGKLLWKRPAPGTVWAVNIPPKGHIVVAAYSDGTIRWHRLSDGAELLALFAHADRKRWVLWTPSGYYDSSPGAEDLIGWQVNRGADDAADFFPASRFRNRFYRPDVVDRILETFDEAKAVALADESRGSRLQNLALVRQLPPVIELLSPSEISTSQPRITVQLRVRSAQDAPVTALRVRVNGQLAPGSRGLVRIDGPPADVRELSIDLPPQDAEVQVFAENRHGVSTPGVVRVNWSGAQTPRDAGTGFVIRPKLYVLAIGVAKYADPRIDKLDFAAKDAKDFAAVIQRQQGRLYTSVEVRLMTDAEATHDSILEGLQWFRRQLTQHDVGMVFLSGHGVNDDEGRYNYLPENADPDKLNITGVRLQDLQDAVGATGKIVVFLDTCHAGNVLGKGRRAAFNDVNRVINELSATSSVRFI